jgi:hypothetical protein
MMIGYAYDLSVMKEITFGTYLSNLSGVTTVHVILNFLPKHKERIPVDRSQPITLGASNRIENGKKISPTRAHDRFWHRIASAKNQMIPNRCSRKL